jgi:hypothetical protein
MSQHTKILNQINRLHRTDRKIRLINITDKIPTTSSANIVAIVGDTIFVKAHEAQFACMNRDKETFLQSDYIPDVVKAQVITLDFTHRLVALSSFEYVERWVEQRKQERVSPDNPVRVVMQNLEQGIEIDGDLVDISPGGMSFSLAHTRHNPTMYEKGTKVVTIIGLPLHGDTPHAELSISGTIANKVCGSDETRGRIGIQTSPDSTSISVIEAYMSQRKNKMLDEYRTSIQ